MQGFSFCCVVIAIFEFLTFDDLWSIFELLAADLRLNLLSHSSKGDCSVDVLSVDHLGDV